MEDEIAKIRKLRPSEMKILTRIYSVKHLKDILKVLDIYSIYKPGRFGELTVNEFVYPEEYRYDIEAVVGIIDSAFCVSVTDTVFYFCIFIENDNGEFIKIYANKNVIIPGLEKIGESKLIINEEVYRKIYRESHDIAYKAKMGRFISNLKKVVSAQMLDQHVLKDPNPPKGLF